MNAGPSRPEVKLPVSPVVDPADEEISLLALATILLRRRWGIARWVLAGTIIAGVWAITRAPLYSASASFVPQTPDGTRSGLAGLAGQLGVTIPGANASLSPDFYAQLLQSRELLAPLATDTLLVPERGNRRYAVEDLLEITDGTPKARQDEAVKKLGRILSVTVVRNTGVVAFTVTTRWPSVSLALSDSLVQAVNAFNVRTRQEQAAEERKFVEGRLAVAQAELRASEDRLEQFLASNRQLANSPELTFERERLQRDLAAKQQVYTDLMQSYEEVRLREVRATPVITMFESPSVPAKPDPRGRVKILLLGALLGAFVGTMLALIGGIVARRRRDGDADVDAFFQVLAELRPGVPRRLRRVSPGSRESR